MITVMSYRDIMDWLEQSAHRYLFIMWYISDPLNKLAETVSEFSIEVVNSGCSFFLSYEIHLHLRMTMPNLVMEYSNSVDERVNVQGLLEDLHQVTLQCGLFDVGSVKSRALRCHNWLIGDEGDSVDFIHISFELLAGRSDEQKRDLSRQLMDVLQQQASHVRSLTVNIRDMDTECFQKVIN
jgi:5-carboxymethyl-2-hydroxymuconate isomerase